MKAVRFLIEAPQPIAVEYDRDKLKNDLRDKLVPRLMRCFNRKLEKGEVENYSDISKYLTLILETAIGSEFSIKELKKIEPYFKKFAFLPYKPQANSGRGHSCTDDDSIHETAFHLIALCRGYKNIVGQHIYPMMMLESRRDYSGNKYVGYDKANAISEGVAKLTRESIEEFLQELHETGRIMTSAELAKLHREKAEPSTDDSFTSSEHDNEGSTDRPSDSSSGGDRTASQDSNNDAHQRSAFLIGINDDADDDPNNTGNSAKTELDNELKFSTYLIDFLSWIYELPEWLQEQILNSAPVRSLLEEAKKGAAILDSKYIQNQIEKIYTAETTNKSEDITADKQSEKAVLIELTSQDLIDTSMILEDHQVTGLILPMVDINSGNIFGENEFGGLANFNGLNDLEIF